MQLSRGALCAGVLALAPQALSTSVDVLQQDDACTAEDGGACSSELLQLNSERAPVDTSHWKPTQELISAVYTFGAPATHAKPWRNMASTNGCFPGLRSYNEDIKGAFDEIKQVDAASMNNFYPHAWTNTVCLHYERDSIYVPCEPGQHGKPEWPQRGGSVYEEWGLHQEDDYTDRLKSLTIDGKPMSHKDPFKTAINFVRMAFKSYDRPVNVIKALTEIPEKGWKLVGWEEDVNGDDKDPMMLVQREKTLDCALVFTGTDSFSEIFTSTSSGKADYCGFKGVHYGYRNELWTLSKNLIGAKFRSKLEKCNSVTAVGHSLGGALAELFAACANSGRTDNDDYNLFAWTKGTPTMQPEVELCEDGWTKHLSPKCDGGK